MTLHNYRPSRPVRETLNGVNPSSYFRDISVPQSLDPICGKFDTANALAKFQDDIRFKSDPLADFLRFWGRSEQQGDQIWIGLSVCPDDVRGDCERVYQAHFVMCFLVHRYIVCVCVSPLTTGVAYGKQWCHPYALAFECKHKIPCCIFKLIFALIDGLGILWNCPNVVVTGFHWR